MAQAQVQLQKPSEGGTSRRSQTRLQESTTEKRALYHTEGRKATLLLRKIPPSAPRPGHWRRKYSQTVTFWRKRFAPGISRIHLSSESSRWRAAPAALRCGEALCSHQRNRRSQKGVAEEGEPAGTLLKGTIYPKTKFLELSIECLKLPRTVHLS